MFAALVLSAFALTACGGGGGGDAAPAASTSSGSGSGSGGTPPSPPPPPPGTDSASLSWTPPMFYSDNTPLTIEGYKFYAGTSQGAMTLVDTVPTGGISSHVLTGLATGTTWYFAVTAYDSQGVESTFSNVATASL